MHAWVPPGAAWSGHQFPSEQLCLEWEEAASQRLARALELAFGGHPPGLRARPVIAEGPPGEILVRAACRPDDLLVIGTGRRAAVSRLWHGGVSRYCLAHAHCPVIAIPPPALELAARQWISGPVVAAPAIDPAALPSMLRQAVTDGQDGDGGQDGGDEGGRGPTGTSNRSAVSSLTATAPRMIASPGRR